MRTEDGRLRRVWARGPDRGGRTRGSGRDRTLLLQAARRDVLAMRAGTAVQSRRHRSGGVPRVRAAPAGRVRYVRAGFADRASRDRQFAAGRHLLLSTAARGVHRLRAGAAVLLG